MKNSLVIVICIFLLGLSSCHEQPQTATAKVSNSQLKESLEKANRYLASDEEEDIQNYVRRH